jgi:hypothetical protein
MHLWKQYLNRFSIDFRIKIISSLTHSENNLFLNTLILLAKFTDFNSKKSENENENKNENENESIFVTES